jgi:hypothetical protein
MRAALAMIRSLRLGLHIAIPTAGIESEAAALVPPVESFLALPNPSRGIVA